MLMTTSDTTLTDRQRQFITESQKAWGRMAGLAEEISELSHLEAGTLKIDQRSVDLAKVLSETVASLPPMEDSPIEVDLVTPDAPTPLQGDAARLKAAFAALLFALRREVVTSPTLFVREIEREYKGQPVWWVAIGDATHVETLADAAPEALATFDEWRGGSGLKLAIARRIIAAHGGGLWSREDGSRASAVVALPR
jgi:signal transduction histidine kinase